MVRTISWKKCDFSLILAIFAPKISYLQGFGGRTDRNPNPREDKNYEELIR